MSEREKPDVIHKLKNHIAVVAGFAELLLADCGEDDPKRADLLEIHNAAQQAMALIPEVARRLHGGSHES
jgi:hypothetical protein